MYIYIHIYPTLTLTPYYHNFCASARGRGEQLSVRLSENQRSDGGIPDADYLLRRRDYLQKVSLPDAQMGRGRGC